MKLIWRTNDKGGSASYLKDLRLTVWQDHGTGFWGWCVDLEDTPDDANSWLGKGSRCHSEPEAQQAAENALYKTLLEMLKVFE